MLTLQEYTKKHMSFYLFGNGMMTYITPTYFMRIYVQNVLSPFQEPNDD